MVPRPVTRRGKQLIAIAVTMAIAMACAVGFAAWRSNRAPDPASRPPENEALPTAQTGLPASPVRGDVVTVADTATIATKGVTPMAERLAVIGLLNKRNGESRDLTMKPGQAVRVGNAIVRLRACERTGPWEPEQYTGAFAQLDVQGVDRRWRRVFSGWLYKERPSLNVVQHPIYDVWVKSCTMSFPAGGADTVPLGKSDAAPKRSSAPNSPASEGTPANNPPAEGPSESPSNAI
jgi:hypothetical protein